MSTLQELRAAINHITVSTGDPVAWQRGLTPDDLVSINAAAVDPAATSGLLAKIRANHPALFDSKGRPVNAADAGRDQRGVAAEAIKQAEDDLSQQNSSAAQLDLQVIGAILNAHTAAVVGDARLERLQYEIETAIRSRTDLDTPAGARDFQRFLIGKLREIGDVVETTDLDATSKATLANAWSALYRAAGTPPPADPAVPVAAPARTPAPNLTAAAHPSAAAVPSTEALPAYGADLAGDPLMDAMLADDLAAAPMAPHTVPASMPPSAPAPFPTALPSGFALPTMPGLPAELGRAALGPGTPQSDTALLDSLLGALLDEDDRSLEPDDTGPPDNAADDGAETKAPTAETVPAPVSTTVALPDGTSVRAPTPQLANVLRAAVAGTPVAEAFRAEFIAIPPPGSAVPRPLASSEVTGGDVGMFPDRQAVALDRHRALLDGRIQPVASVSGPSFLGWLHPLGRESTPTGPADAAAR